MASNERVPILKPLFEKSKVIDVKNNFNNFSNKKKILIALE